MKRQIKTYQYGSSLEIESNMSETAKVPLGCVTNRLSSRSSAPLKILFKAPTACTNCEAQDECIQSLRAALLEVAEENDVLRERVVELEAILTQVEEACSDSDTRLEAQIRALV